MLPDDRHKPLDSKQPINVKGIKTKSEPYKIHSAPDSDHAKERGRTGEGRDTGQGEEQELQLEQLLQKAFICWNMSKKQGGTREAKAVTGAPLPTAALSQLSLT